MSRGAVHRPSRVKGEMRLVRYYVSQKAMRQGYKHCPIKTINATHIDALVRALVLEHLDGQVSLLAARAAQTKKIKLRFGVTW